MRLKRRTAKRGAALVEFALVSTLLFLLLFGIIEVGLLLGDQAQVGAAAREAARAAALAAALAYAAATGLLRMGFGGHFLSDTLLAALFTWLVIAAVWRTALGLRSPRADR